MQCKMLPECCHHRHLSVCSARCYQNAINTDTCLYAVQDATKMLSSQTHVCMQCMMLPECCHHRHLSVCSARCHQNAVITDTCLYASSRNIFLLPNVCVQCSITTAALTINTSQLNMTTTCTEILEVQ